MSCFLCRRFLLLFYFRCIRGGHIVVLEKSTNTDRRLHLVPILITSDPTFLDFDVVFFFFDLVVAMESLPMLCVSEYDSTIDIYRYVTID
jgi:hypothetical protein